MQLLRRAADLAQHLAKGQRIQAHLPEDEVRVDGDPNRLEQVIINLLDNAIVYAEGTKCIDLRLRVAGEQAEVVVQDYGPGIPAADLPHVFTRFYRGSSAGRRAAGGLGLGLYISHQLVAAHGGHIDVRSVRRGGYGVHHFAATGNVTLSQTGPCAWRRLRSPCVPTIMLRVARG